ncbi:MAG TPA: ribonuclease III [Sphingomicrobium sp.]|nr:ribonuclease III [Sphingomicrobium sp.]
MKDEVAAFVAGRLQHQAKELSLFEQALTHSSSRGENYERLEFLGDRVLGLTIAHWLYERFPTEPEGKLSQRYNMLVARETCGEVGRELGLPALIRLGKQAREDGANWSDNVVGDVVEAVIGAIFLERGFEAAEAFIRREWKPLIEEQRGAPKHPKSALQELAAARDLPNPDYEVIGRTGAHHSPRFTVRVSIRSLGEADAEGSSKQEAETEAAKALLSKLSPPAGGRG